MSFSLFYDLIFDKIDRKDEPSQVIVRDVPIIIINCLAQKRGKGGL